MQTTYEPRNTSQELSDRIKGHVEELANATDVARLSDVIQNYLKAASIFHQYSFNNILLINFAYPCATRVAGFQAWRKLNRRVRKGESGIPIWTPIVVKEKTEGSEGKSFLKGFKVVYVFDISQTDGDPLPEPPGWKSPERSAELQYRLMTFARRKGIVATVKQLAGEIQGVRRGGAIDIAPDAGTRLCCMNWRTSYSTVDQMLQQSGACANLRPNLWPGSVPDTLVWSPAGVRTTLHCMGIQRN